MTQRNCFRCGITVSRTIERAGKHYCLLCASPTTVSCNACGHQLDDDQAVVGPNHNFYCLRCHQNAFRFCDICGQQAFRTVLVRIDGQALCPDCAAQQAPRCACCRKILTEDTTHSTGYGPYCTTCFDREFAHCNFCHEIVLRSDLMPTYNGNLICYHCEHDRHNWESKDFAPTPATYTEIGSTRTFGVEFETSSCNHFSDLYDTLILGCKDDYSIAGKEFITPVLYGDQGLAVIKDFCDIAQDKEWEVNNTCGLHLHLGLTSETPQQLKSIAYAYYNTFPYWKAVVHHSRHGNNMCSAPKYPRSVILGIENQEDFDYFASERDRFEFVNWRAYILHGTVELRILHGTLDSEEVCNWIKAHTKFLEFVKDKTCDDLNALFGGSFNALKLKMADILGLELAHYYETKMLDYQDSELEYAVL